MPNGAPPANYIQQLVPIFDWSKFNRDNQPIHPIFDDSYWLVSLADLFGSYLSLVLEIICILDDFHNYPYLRIMCIINLALF